MKNNGAIGDDVPFPSEALKRARSLLDIGTFLNVGDAVDQGLSVFQDSRFGDAPSKKENDFYSAFAHPRASKSKHFSATFISPLKSSANHVQPCQIMQARAGFAMNLAWIAFYDMLVQSGASSQVAASKLQLS
ncbi:hypothetical protein OIU77_030234 [Salix suchowensis]|uniref:Uncharacterized protein n=1 Tax=Salix suchowensis TaxID=1278906 RepID=A0ABQ9BD04_9ROSI|nr:hypothetical protein OIU77_030234 [Salix suchowensis]